MRINGFYLFTGLFFFAMLWVSARFFKGASHSFVGVAVSREFKISVEKASLVTRIAVVPGQQVKGGDLLVEVSSAALDIEIDKLETRITAARSEQTEKAKLARSQEALIKAEVNVRTGELNTTIIQKENELKLNRSLTNETLGTGPLNELILSLKEQKAGVEKAGDIQVASVRMQNEADQLVLSNQIQLLQRELDLLLKEQKSLNRYASAPGVVENIFIKEGEQVEAFTSLMSINPQHPTTVIGYLVGKKETIEIGASVEVRSFENRTVVQPGKVIGYGAVVSLPDILQKATATKAFGREVFIEMEPGTVLASGERVLIR